MPAPAAPGVHDFVDLDEYLTAATVEDFLMSQSVPRFVDADARDAQIPDPVEGQLCYVLGVGLQVYTPADGWAAPPSSVTSVAGRTGDVTLTKTDVGLSNVDNTSDLAKPVSTATQTALNAKAPLASPAFTGTATAAILDAATLRIGGVDVGTWQTYTPTIAGTGWALGNATVTGRYCRIGKLVSFVAEVIFGSTSTFGTGGLELSLPVTAKTPPPYRWLGAAGGATGGGAYQWSLYFASTTAARPVIPASNTGATIAITSTVPFTWASGNSVWIAGTYEAA